MRVALLFATGILALFCFLSPAAADNATSAAPTGAPATPADLTMSANPSVRLLEIRSCIGCNLQNADLSSQDLRGVNLSHANLENANLKGANLMAAVLRDANLQQADLREAELLAVDLTGANLKGAKFSRVDLDTARICRTIAPDGNLSRRDC